MLHSSNVENQRRRISPAATTERLRGLVRRLRRAIGELRRENAALRQELAAARELAFVDPLTSALNRRYFDRRLAEEVARARRDRIALSLAVIDVDQMKVVNDRFGHAAGDQVLREVAAQLRTNLRSHDVLCRVGGDEFVALLPGTNARQARELARRARTAVRVRGPWGVRTISAGTATLDGDRDSAEALFRRADQAMYRDKLARAETPRASSCDPA